MTLSRKDAIADAVRASLIAAGLVPASRITREHAFEKSIEEVARIEQGERVGPLVTVWPKDERTTRTSRKTFAHEYDISVCVQSYCQFADKDWLNRLTYIVEQICDRLATAGTMENAKFMTKEIDQSFDTERLHDLSQFCSMPTFTYRLERSA